MVNTILGQSISHEIFKQRLNTVSEEGKCFNVVDTSNIEFLDVLPFVCTI